MRQKMRAIKSDREKEKEEWTGKKRRFLTFVNCHIHKHSMPCTCERECRSFLVALLIINKNTIFYLTIVDCYCYLMLFVSSKVLFGIAKMRFMEMHAYSAIQLTCAVCIVQCAMCSTCYCVHLSVTLGHFNNNYIVCSFMHAAIVPSMQCFD